VCSVWTKLDSLVFSDRIELRIKELCLQALIDLLPPLSLSTKKSWGGLQEAPLVVIFFFSAFFIAFIIMGVSRRRAIKWRVK
jgi:hypothetical protein